MKRILILICTILCANVLSAQTFTVGGVKYTVNQDGSTVTVTGNTLFQSTYLTIPETVANPETEISYTVTSIGDNAFRDSYNANNIYHLKSAVIPNTVTSIGNHAFFYCRNLTSITIGDNVTSIGQYAFYYCKIPSVNLPNSLTSIGNYAFSYCTALTSITIPSNVTYIGMGAFNYCSALTDVTFHPTTAPQANSYVFSSTPSSKTLTVPFGSNYSSWDNPSSWSKIEHKINKGETKVLNTTFEITAENERTIINDGVLRIVQGGELVNTTDTNVGGIIEVEAINREKWNYIGAPFANNYILGTILPQTNDVSVSLFDYTEGEWNEEWATYDNTVNIGEGFAAWNWNNSPIVFTTYGDIWNYETNQVGEYNFEQEPVYSLNNENEITISYQDNNSSDDVNWLAVANPYTFKLDIATIRTNNGLQGDVLYTYNGTNFVPVIEGEIKVTEGFFVNSSSLTFKKTQRYIPAKSTAKREFIKLAMIDGDNEVEVLFAHNEDAEQEYDIFDANKLFSPMKIAEPYLVTNNIALVKEEVKTLPYTAELNVKSYENKEVTFRANNIPEGINVYLFDNEEIIKMNGGIEYTTDITAGENADRFKLLVRKQARIENTTANDITINNDNRNVKVQSDVTNLRIEVYNSLGRKVFETTNYNFTLNQVPAGAYMIKAFNNKASKTQKIVVE